MTDARGEDDLRRMAAEVLGGEPDDYRVEIGDTPILFRTIDVPVIDGVATLPDGRTVLSVAKFVRVPYLTPEDHQRLADLLPDADPAADHD